MFILKSLRELYKKGKGPSSSHTMGPNKAAILFKSENPDADMFKVELFGSLAKTGKGHRTDTAVYDALLPVHTEVVFRTDYDGELPHPNTLDFYAYKNGVETNKMRVMSVGGGEISIEGRPDIETPDVYMEKNFTEIRNFCRERNIRLSDYVELIEGKQIWDFLFDTWNTMKKSINKGLVKEGILEGGLGISRYASRLYNQRHIDESSITRENRIVCSYAFAASEENADCGTIVTAPTCGACAVVPAVLKYMQEKHNFSDKKILRALAAAGVVGNVVKSNASISGAECGCQAEIGTACSMAAAGLAELFEMGLHQIEYSAETSLEHHLGLTCDPLCGLVQIPCIERNAVAAMRAINSLSLANFLTGTRKISFDMVVQTMYNTGKDLKREYRETSEGGLAEIYG